MTYDISLCAASSASRCPRAPLCLRATAGPLPHASWIAPEPDGCEHFVPHAGPLPPPEPGEDFKPYNVRWFDL